KVPKLVIITGEYNDYIKQYLPCEPSILRYTSMQTKPIIINYQNSTEFDEYHPDNDDLYLKAAMIAFKYHKNKYEGNYLIFVPGQEEFELVYNELNNLFGQAINIYLIHQEMSMADLQFLQNIAIVNTRNIVIAINITECHV